MTKNLSMKNTQFKTTPDSENESWLIFGLESDGLYDDVSKIHCLVIYDLQSGNTFSYGPDAIDNAIAKLTIPCCFPSSSISMTLSALIKLLIKAFSIFLSISYNIPF